MSEAPYRYEKLSEQAFDALVEIYPTVTVPVEQSPLWARFEAALGRRPYGMWAYYSRNGALVATASYLHISRRFRESLVVVNGPVWFSERTASAETELMRTVQSQFARAAGVNPLYVRMQIRHPRLPALGPLEHGWYEREIVVDLEPEEEAIFKSFRPNARNSIRRAKRAGIEVVSIPRSEWIEVFRNELYPILEETAARDNFQSFERSYYEKFMTELGDYVRLLVAYQDRTAVSWLITTEYRGYGVYYFAGSSHQARKNFAPYLLLWEAFRALKAAGNHSCGLTGIVSENYPQLINVTTFKRNFSSNVVELPTTYDIPLHGVRYRILAILLGLRRGVPVFGGTARRGAGMLGGLFGGSGRRNAAEGSTDTERRG